MNPPPGRHPCPSLTQKYYVWREALLLGSRDTSASGSGPS